MDWKESAGARWFSDTTFDDRYMIKVEGNKFVASCDICNSRIKPRGAGRPRRYTPVEIGEFKTLSAAMKGAEEWKDRHFFESPQVVPVPPS